MRIKITLILFLIIFASCQEEFSLESGLNKNRLVINGIIDNNPPPYTVKLSRASDAGDPSFIPETGAVLKIIDQDGNTEQLNETQAGIYKTSETGMTGEIGNSYKLNVKLSDGNEYETDFQTLQNSVDIDSIYYEKEYQQSTEFPSGLPGYQFYVNTKQADHSKTYFLWRMEETYEYNVDYQLAYILDIQFNELVEIWNTPKFDTIRTCWKTSVVNSFTTGSTENLSETAIKKKPIQFVGTDNKKLTVRYSLLLKQYRINKSAYTFWNLVEKLVSEDNFLAGYQPSNIQGNLKNMRNENELVFGYFTVASVSEKRIFLNTIHAPFFYEKCLVLTDTPSINAYMLSHSPPYYFVFAYTDNSTFGLIPNASCLDCRSEGGTLSKPEFWTLY